MDHILTGLRYRTLVNL